MSDGILDGGTNNLCVLGSGKPRISKNQQLDTWINARILSGDDTS